MITSSVMLTSKEANREAKCSLTIRNVEQKLRFRWFFSLMFKTPAAQVQVSALASESSFLLTQILAGSGDGSVLVFLSHTCLSFWLPALA